jgi:uncharacterized lipoprotein YddW (UPF0748 family)
MDQFGGYTEYPTGYRNMKKFFLPVLLILFLLSCASTIRLSSDESSTQLLYNENNCRTATGRIVFEHEIRGVWEHTCMGPYAGDWKKAAEILSECGFNTIFPNALYGCSARYPSSFLEHSDRFFGQGDLLYSCIEEAHSAGIDVHVWIIMWKLMQNSEAYVSEMADSGRLQVSMHGDTCLWLCPSNPENRNLEIRAVREIVENYDIDGIHLDYIRYPNFRNCYCSGCHERFQNDTGIRISIWPDQVLHGERYYTQYQEWREEQITSIVREIYEMVKELRGNVLVSAAVLPYIEDARDNDGQNWQEWAEEGIIDFLVPMDYTDSFTDLISLLNIQIEYIGGNVPVLAGLGAFSHNSILTPQQLLEQIDNAREAGVSGFVIFHYKDILAEEHLPYLKNKL